MYNNDTDCSGLVFDSLLKESALCQFTLYIIMAQISVVSSCNREPNYPITGL